jgi:hypothetical protein
VATPGSNQPYGKKPSKPVAGMNNKTRVIQYNSPIHASRIIRFDGKRLPVRKRAQNVYWEDSVYTSLFEPLRDWQVSHGYIANIIADFSMAVMKIGSFASLLGSEGGDEQVTKMLETMALMRSVLGAQVVGPEDEYSWQSRTTTGLPELMEKLSERLQAYTDIPATILFNKSPSGMNATGNHEMQVWYNVVQAHQKLYYAPIINRLLEVVFMSKSGPTNGKIPKTWGYEWIPLWQPTELEQAQARKATAETDQLYNDMAGGILAEPIITQRFGSSRYQAELRLPADMNFPPVEPDEKDPSTAEGSEKDKHRQLMDAYPGLGIDATEKEWEAEQINMNTIDKNFHKQFEGKGNNDVAPPGWASTVEKMKTSGKVENPFALSWWMWGQGYSPSK